MATAPRWCAWGGAIEAAIDRPRLASFAAGHRGYERDSEPSLDKCLHRLDLRAAATDPRADLAPRAEAEHLVADFVEWDTPQGTTVGRIKRKLTRPTKIKTHKLAASRENPEYLVETDKSKKLAPHEPSALRKQKRRNSYEFAFVIPTWVG